MTDRSTALRILEALRQSPVGDTAVLVGSSGLFGFETRVPALTEDVDISVPEPIVEQHGPEIVEALSSQGFDHEHGTATFVSGDGITFDLLGHGDFAEGDHIGGAGILRVMVFEDISRIVGDEKATTNLPQGGKALTPAGFVASKLLGAMAERRRGRTAEERLADLERGRARLRRERMLRDLAGPRWRRMVEIIPVLFRREGIAEARVLRAEPAAVIEALRQDAVFALDTAMRLAHGFGFLSGGDVHAYLTSPEPLDRLAKAGLIEAAPCPDTILVRPWSGPARLLASIVRDTPASRVVGEGYRVVTGSGSAESSLERSGHAPISSPCWSAPKSARSAMESGPGPATHHPPSSALGASSGSFSRFNASHAAPFAAPHAAR